MIDAHTLFIDRHRNRAQSVDLENLQCSRIGWRLDDDLVARLCERLRDDHDALRRTGQNDHIFRRNRAGAARIHARRNRSAQRFVAF